MMNQIIPPSSLQPVERRRWAGCAAAALLVVGGAADAQPAPEPTVCVLAAARIDPAAFARAQLRNPYVLQGCELEPASEPSPGSKVAVPALPPVRIDPAPAAAGIEPPPAPETQRAPVSPVSGAPADSRAASGRQSATAPTPARSSRAFSDRMRNLDPQVEEAARRNEIDPLLLHAVIHVESRHRIDAVSPAGARGAMQVMPQTAMRFGVHSDRYLHEPEFNLAAGAAYLKMLQAEFDGDLDLVLAAYNAGEGAVRRHGRRIPPYPETQAYVREVRAMHQRLRTERERDVGGPAGPSEAIVLSGQSAP